MCNYHSLSFYFFYDLPATWKVRPENLKKKVITGATVRLRSVRIWVQNNF